MEKRGKKRHSDDLTVGDALILRLSSPSLFLLASFGGTDLAPSQPGLDRSGWLAARLLACHSAG